MIDFYENWDKDLHLGHDINRYIMDFLSKIEESQKIFSSNDINDISLFYSIISSIPISVWFQNLLKIKIEMNYTSYDIPCFSNFESGIIRLPEILEFHEEGLSFEKAGFELIKSETILAKEKYGENHSKLAASAKLVSITKTKPYIVKLTSIGHFLTGLKLDEKQVFLKVMFLLDPYYSYVIQHILHGKINFSDTVSFLSEKTQMRRRSNVKTVIKFILSGTEHDNKFSNINW